MQIKNKKGEIPTTILVLMIVLVCMLAIFSFFHSKKISSDYFVGIGTIETVKAFSEETSFIEKTEFSSDSGTLFESGSVKVILNSGSIEGSYSKRGFPIIGDKEKVLVRVIYQR